MRHYNALPWPKNAKSLHFRKPQFKVFFRGRMPPDLLRQGDASDGPYLEPSSLKILIHPSNGVLCTLLQR